MDSFELNKVMGAVLGTLLFAFGTGFLSELIYEPKPAGKAGYALPGGGGGGEGGHGGEEAAKEKAKPEGVAALLASADPEKGKAGSKSCQGCHSLEKGGANKVGPHLWEVVGRKKGGVDGFEYSGALKEKGGEWSYDDLDKFLLKPGEYAKGTKMSFQGISSAQDRANVIAYLRTLADSPKPLPEAAKAEDKKEEGKKDEGKGDGKAADKGGEAAGGFAAKVASADPKKGEAEIKPCQSCHSFEKGGPNKMGPDLWGVVGRKKGGVEGFDYSGALKEKGGEWGYDDLNQFLLKPGDYVKGTKMAFQGVSSEEKRALIVAYLRTLADEPKPLPGGDKAADKKDEGKQDAKAAEKPADGGKEAAKPEGDKKPEEAKPTEGEKKSEGDKPAEDKGAEKAAEKPAKPEGDSKPEDAKAAEGDKKSDDAKSDDAKPADDKGADKAAEKPAETPPEGEKKSDGDKPAGEKPAQP